MDKFTLEEKKKAVNLVLNEHYSYLRAARSIGASKTTVIGWVNIVMNHGFEALPSGKTHSTYTGAFKLEVVKYMQENKLSSYATAAHFGINKNQVMRWLRIYEEEGETSLMTEKRGKKRMNKPRIPAEEKKDILKELDYLRMENEYLKKLNALVRERIEQESKKK